MFHPQGNEHWLFMCKIRQITVHKTDTIYLGVGEVLLSLAFKLHKKVGNVAQYLAKKELHRKRQSEKKKVRALQSGDNKATPKKKFSPTKPVQSHYAIIGRNRKQVQAQTSVLSFAGQMESDFFFLDQHMTWKQAGLKLESTPYTGLAFCTFCICTICIFL